MGDSECLSYNEWTRFSRKSAACLPIGGRSMFGLLFLYIMISYFFKRVISVVWQQTTIVLIREGETAFYCLITAGDGICFLEYVLSLSLLLIIFRLVINYEKAPPSSVPPTSPISLYRSCLIMFCRYPKRRNERSPKIL